jgi:hypothetical protein
MEDWSHLTFLSENRTAPINDGIARAREENRNRDQEATVRAPLLHRQAMKRNTESVALCLHTDQQSLILGEMMTARNKLQEENQLLRDKLQDAEMLIQLLQHKLKEQAALHYQQLAGHKQNAKKGLLLHGKQHLALHQSLKGAAVAAASLSPQSAAAHAMRGAKLATGKNAFRNETAPGKRTFSIATTETTTTASGYSSATSSAASNSLKRDLFPSKGTVVLPTRAKACGSPDSRHAEPSEPSRTPTKSQRHANKSDCTGGGTTNSRRRATVSPPPRSRTLTTKQSSSLVAKQPIAPHISSSLFSEEQFPGSAQQRRSVIGKLAQVVINEYSQNDDHELIFI